MSKLYYAIVVFFVLLLPHINFADRLSVSDLSRTDLAVDYLVITPSYFENYARGLCEYRLNSPHINNPHYILTEEVYDSFLHLYSNHENPRALSIRHAIRNAAQNLSGLRYIVLFGAGYMESEERAQENFIPAIYDHSNPTHALDGLRVTDDLYISDTINYVHIYPISLSIGRISVRNQQQAQMYLDKLAEYENINNSGLWKNRVLVVSDDDLNGPSPTELEIDPIFHEGYLSLFLYPSIPSHIDKRRIYLGAYELDVNNELSLASLDISSILNMGVNFFVYAGHTWAGGLSAYNVLANWNLGRYFTSNKLTISLLLGCQAGDFNTTATEMSLAERMVFSDSLGAIAALGATGFLTAEANNTFGGEFFRFVYENENDYTTLGSVVRRAKNTASLTTNTRISSYVLFGCPAIIIRTPEYRESLIAPIDTLVGFSNNNIVLNPPYSGSWIYEIEFYDVEQFIEYERYIEPLFHSYTNRGGVIHSQEGQIGSNGEVVLLTRNVGGDAFGISAGVYMRNGLVEFVSYIDSIYRLGNIDDTAFINLSSFYNLSEAYFDVLLSPNPVQEFLNITVLNSDESIIGKNLEASIFTIQGQQISKKIIPINKLGAIEAVFDMKKANHGVFVAVFNIDGKKPQKLMFTKVE